MISVYVLQSWAWASTIVPLALLSVAQAIWSAVRGDEPTETQDVPGQSEIDRDIKERQHRQDAQLPKIYPHV